MNSGKQKLKTAVKMCAYAAEDMLGGGVGQVLSLYYLAFLMYVAGLSPWMAGLVTGIGKVWDGITDPIMGVIVDRTKTRLGSCRPWLLISVIPVFLSYFMLWTSFGITGLYAKFFYYIFAYMFFSTSFTIAIIPYEAMLPKMVDSYRERTNYSSVRMVFSGIAAVASTYIYEWLIPTNNGNNLSAAFSKNFVTLGLVLGAFFALPALLTFFGTKEKPSLSQSGQKMTLRAVFRGYKEVLSGKLYRKYFALNLLGTFVGSSISAALVIFIYLTYGNTANFLLGFTLVFVVINLKGAVEIAFFVPNLIMMKRVSKHFPYLIDIPLIIAGCLIILFVNPAVSPWLFILAACLIGAGVSCLGFVPMTLLPDLSDIDELAFGERREGTSAGLTTLGRKIVGGLTLTLFGLILAAFGLSTESASPASATPSSMLAVKLMLCVIPIISSIFIVILSRTYNLNEKRHNMIKAAIATRRKEGFVVLSDDDKRICEQLSGMAYDKLWISRRGESAEVAEDAAEVL